MLTLFLIGLAIAVTYFAVVWMISVKIHNYGLLDVAWSYGVAILSPIFATFSPGPPARKWLLTIIGVAWSLRLGTYILIRVLRHHPKEDPRYQTLRNAWPGPGKFLAFFELQALMVALFALPFLFTSFDTNPNIHPLTLAAAALAFISLCGEATADLQMQSFKSNPANKDKVCQAGLWHYSRHPNYFFESLIWWAFFLAAVPSPYGWTTIICPLMMLYFLFKVTGIPLTEEYSLKSKGDAYRAYQRTTSSFIPWFPKT
jgi:steroid 5-alpha reductase family enzyme